MSLKILFQTLSIYSTDIFTVCFSFFSSISKFSSVFRHSTNTSNADESCNEDDTCISNHNKLQSSLSSACRECFLRISIR